MRVLNLTLSDGIDPIDGSELNAVRTRALEILVRTEDEMTDLELFARAPDAFWYVDLCLEKLGRLPSEVDPLLGCREYTTIQAYHIVKKAMDEIAREWIKA